MKLLAKPIIALAVSTFLAYMMALGRYKSVVGVTAISSFFLSWIFDKLKRERLSDAFFVLGIVLALIEASERAPAELILRRY